MYGLEIINFTNNAVDSISDDNYMIPMKFKRFRDIILNSNRIRTINITFSRMIPNLKYLLVADNMVSYISPNIFRNLTDLKYLDLSKTQYLYIRKKLVERQYQTNGYFLHIQCNKLNNISNFSQSNALQQVSFSNNYFSGTRGKAFSSLSNLQIVDLTNTNISNLQPENRHYSPLPMP
ncbi:platelet glycoprotein V-like [Mytilus edulis]|uniref:platelet glycoprotein V-like n=1 Tax=Mytilus edulis TaxID=6550 RepID=UPI0039F00A72